MKILNKFLALTVSAVLAVSLLAGCGSSASSTASSAASSEAVSSVAASSEAAASEADSEAQGTVVFTVTGADGNSTEYELKITDGEKLSDALLAAGLISEEEATAGFVTTVNGEAADWNKDQSWWCLTDASGEATSVGIADIELHDGDSYAFTFTK